MTFVLLLREVSVQRANREERSPVELGNPFGEIFARNADMYLATQARLLDSVDALTRAWLNLSREGVDAARDAIQQMAASRDPGEILRIQQRWLSDAFRRTGDDVAELGNGLASAGKKAAANLERQARNAKSPLSPVSEEMMQAAGNKPRRRRSAR
jgi:hypothetical protein